METTHIDLDYLDKMSGGNFEMIKELANLFIKEVPIMVENMQEVINANDWDALRSLAHKAKSTLSIFGMQKLANDMDMWEKLAKRGEQTNTYQDRLDNFHDISLDAIVELNEILSKH